MVLFWGAGGYIKCCVQVISIHGHRWLAFFMKRTGLLFKDSKLPIIVKRQCGLCKCLWSLKEKHILLHDQGENDLSVGNSKPHHKWTHFERNSPLPRTERNQRKPQSLLEVWIHSEFREAGLTFVSEKPKLSFCNTLQSLSFKGGYRTFSIEFIPRGSPYRTLPYL